MLPAHPTFNFPKFWPHQAKAFRKVRDKARIALFMEMRLGKSRIALRWVLRQTENENRKVLIVCPYSAFAGWEKELREHDIEDFCFLSGESELRKTLVENVKASWFITNHECHRSFPEIAELPWSAVIFDESSVLKNPNSAITKFFNASFKHVGRVAVLSGTPAPEDISEFFEQMRFVKGGFAFGYRNFWEFRRKEMNPVGYGWQLSRKATKRFKAWLAENAVFLSRKQVGKFQEKVYTKLNVPRNATQARLQKELVQNFECSLNDVRFETKFAIGVALALRQIASGFLCSSGGETMVCVSDAKLKEIDRILRTELRGGRLVIWAAHTHEILHLCYGLKELGWKRTRYIMGDTPVEKRPEYIERFRAGELDNLIVQPKVLRYGADLSCADAAVFYSNSPSGETRIQAEDRIVHFNRKDPALIIDLVTEDTCDEDLLRTCRIKGARNQHFLRLLKENWGVVDRG